MISGSGCLARRRVITRKGGQATQTLLTANKQTLITQLADRYQAIQSISATVDMVPALGSANKGKITEYKDVRAYLLFRKPSDIRLIGLFPVVRNKAFDMVSNGSRFQVYIPAKNRFIEGRNGMDKPSVNKLENLRPQHFQDALIIQPVSTATERTLLENFTDEENAAYIVEVLHTDENGELWLQRQIWFERLALNVARQILFDRNGDILTDARYGEWQIYDGVAFPKRVDINRPKDEYGVVMTMVKMDINKPLADDKFKLERPEGTELHTLGEKPELAPAPVSPRQSDRKGNKKK
ncbi:MAG: hypothetical protein ABIZ80_11165 [Bryobacteraceae bacterium]